MITIELPKTLENQLWEVVQSRYDGDIQAAISTFLKLDEKYGWKEQFLQDVKTVRSEVRKKGNIKSETIDEAVKKYRKSTGH